MRHSRIARLFAALVLMVMLFVSSMPAFAIGQSTSMAKKGDQYIVTATNLNCRRGPGLNYGVKAMFKKGTKLTYYGNTDGWWKVSSSNGVTGYVDRQFLTPVTTEKNGNYFVTASSLNIRKAPKVSSGIRGTVKKGTIVTISKLNGDWGYLSSGAEATGWVALQHLSHYNKTTTPDNKPTVSTKKMYEVTANALNVRAGASAYSRKIDSIRYGEDVFILKVDGNWGRIVYKESGKYCYGWVSLDYLRQK